MNGYYIKRIGENRGKPRIWLEDQMITRANLNPGDRYEISIKGGAFMLRADPNGSRVISKKENKKTGKVTPVLDINSAELLSLFDGMESVRLVTRKNEIHFLPLATEIRKKERLQRLKMKVQSDTPLDVASLSHGGGLLSHSVKAGLEKEGISSRHTLLNEIRPELLDHSHAVHSWDDRTIAVGAPMQELAFDDAAMRKLERADIAEAGLPCSGASVAGRAKRGTSMPEEHPEVGHLVVAALVILARLNPAVVLLENVIPYASSASASILRNQLRDMGYVTHETVLKGQDFNALEHRDRWAMVAVTEGMHFDWSMLQKPERIDMKVSDILDDVPDDDPSWSEMTGLKAKQERDLAAGKNFKMQIVTKDDERIPTMTKGMAKNRSTDPKFQHPTNPELLRVPSPSEHAKAKQYPPTLIEGLSKTLAHEVLGQAVLNDPFEASARAIAKSIKAFAFENDIDDVVTLAKELCNEITDYAGLVTDQIRPPVAGVSYTGRITVNDLGVAIQDIGNGVGILHRHGAVTSCNLGEEVTIRYQTKKSEPYVGRSDKPAPAVTSELQSAAMIQAHSPAEQHGLFDQPSTSAQSPRMR
ncbi:DNA cytosine methyltransferase [Marinobacter sp.]|uniref:DNA cytosine methyltransferase n=1 Tax=Marinobacter sp. TaxID=50741 RepID=UPI003A8DD028